MTLHQKYLKGEGLLSVGWPTIFNFDWDERVNVNVHSPWKIAYGKVKENGHRFSYGRQLHVIYSDYLPEQLNKYPSLKLDVGSPFWELGQKQWDIFKKRIIGFTSKVNFLPDVTNESLEDAKARMRGSWNEHLQMV